MFDPELKQFKLMEEFLNIVKQSYFDKLSIILKYN